jgi:hypothetical protein
MVNHFEGREKNNRSSGSGSNPYNRPVLVRLTYEYALSDESQDCLLRAFFRSLALSITGENVDFGDKGLEEELCSSLCGFADYLLDNFFLPCLYYDPFQSPISANVSLVKVSTKKTPQPSPAYHSAVQKTQGGAKQFVGTPERLSTLRGTCLMRDRHRCVISRRFDQQEAVKRLGKNGNGAKDDDGNSLASETGFSKLEVAHILPHSLTKVGPGSEFVCFYSSRRGRFHQLTHRAECFQTSRACYS